MSLGYTYEYDTRITGLNPNGGVLLRFGQDFAGLGGDTRVHRDDGAGPWPKPSVLERGSNGPGDL